MFKNKDILLLSHFEIGFRRYKKLSNVIEDFSEIKDKKIQEISQYTRINPEILKKLSDKNFREEILEGIIKNLEIAGVNYVTVNDVSYPQKLHDLQDKPLILFYKGDFSILSSSLTVGVVGTRHNDINGKMYTEKLTKMLVDNGVIVISGLARGIDIIAHRKALDEGGKTVAVLGGGVDVVYPKEHLKEYERICKMGCVVSEFPIGKSVMPRNFFVRNRIISGLSDAVVVVQAPENSGALITGNYALSQRKQLFAFPGEIENRLHRGCNLLIKNGARIVLNIEDILESLGYKSLKDSLSNNEQFQDNLSDEEKLIYSYITKSVDIESLSEMTGLSVSQIYPTLLSLEIKGLIVQNIGGTFSRVLR